MGRAPQIRSQRSTGLSASPAGANSSTGTALFWTGSQALGIAFADSSDSQCGDSPADDAGAAEAVADRESEPSHPPLEIKALAHGLEFKDSAEHEEAGAARPGSAAINGHVLNEEVQDDSSKASGVAKEALAERADEDGRQRGVSAAAAAAVAEVDAEKAQQEHVAPQRSQPAAVLSGELPPGEQLSERGSMDEEREVLSVSPVSSPCRCKGK